MNTKLPILVTASAFALGASLQSQVIYEDFDFSTGTLAAESGGSWAGSGTVVSPGLTFGDLDSSSSTNTARIDGQTASFDVGASLNGLLDDGDTLWFSVLLNVQMGTNQGFGFALGTDSVSSSNTTPMSNSGDGFGIRGKNGVRASSWVGGTRDESSATGIGSLTTTLVVGEMIFNADNGLADTINLYLPSTSLVQGGVVQSQTAVLNQTTFDTISFASKGATSGDTIDEIRFGTSYADVTPVPEPGSFALIGGFLALTSIMLRRRRS